LWEAGGDILNADNTQAAFNSEAGVRAATTLQEIQQDGSLYLDYPPDSGQYGNLFNSGKIGMLITGPWDLSGFPDVNYGVQFMPSFDPGGSHMTIAGPDNWVIFDNGPDNVNASWEFLKFMASPENVLKDSLARSPPPSRPLWRRCRGSPRSTRSTPASARSRRTSRTSRRHARRWSSTPRSRATSGRRSSRSCRGRRRHRMP